MIVQIPSLFVSQEDMSGYFIEEDIETAEKLIDYIFKVTWEISFIERGQGDNKPPGKLLRSQGFSSFSTALP